MTDIDAFVATWEGTGSWHEADRKSATYRVRQTMQAAADGFEVAFRHDPGTSTIAFYFRFR